MSEPLTIERAQSARTFAVVVDLAAVGASLAANIAAAPASAGSWAIAAVAPLALFAIIGLAHRSQGILVGWLGRAFYTGLAGIAIGAAWISYGHLKHVAIAMGQSEQVARIIPLVVDGAAVMASIVVVAAGQTVNELERANAEASAAARQEQRRAVDDENRRKREASIAADKARTEAVEARERLAAIARSDKTNGATAKKASGKGMTKVEEKAFNEANIAAYLTEHPDARQSAVAEFLGLSPRTVARSAAWRELKASKNGHSPEEVSA